MWKVTWRNLVARKVRLLLSQLDRPYHLIEVDIFGGQSKTDAYLALNPDGRIPLLVLEDGLPTRVVLKDIVEEIQFSRRARAELDEDLQALFYDIDRRSLEAVEKNLERLGFGPKGQAVYGNAFEAAASRALEDTPALSIM